MVDLDKILRFLKETLESSKPLGPFTYGQVDKWEKATTISVPFVCRPKSGTDEYLHAAFAYAAPASVNVVGSYPIKAGLSPHQADMIVEMPAELVKDKDHLNYRYLTKKAFYLACVYDVLRKANLGDAEVDLGGAAVVVKFPDGSSVRVLPYTRNLKPFRLAPDRSSVRPSIFADASDSEEPPTPQLNSMMLSDLLFNEQLKWLKSASKRIPQFSAGLKLVKAWLKQRSFEDVEGRLAGFHVSILLGYMAQQGFLDESMDELHILKVFLKFFGEFNFDQPHSLCDASPVVPEEFKESFSLESFAKCYDVVFVDSTGYLNLFWNVSKQALRLVQSEAKRHYSLIVADPTQLQLLLLQPDDVQLKFDVTVTVGCKVDSAQMERLLERALSDRVTSLCCRRTDDSMVVGLQLNPENAFRLVDLGPPVEDKEGCAAFRQFWGAKSELRRFKDSSIKETAVWEEFAKERHLIVGAICQHILKRHLAIDDVSCDAGRLDFAVARGSFGPVLAASEELAKRLRAGFKSVPLTITAVEPISPACRYTDVALPRPLSSCKAGQLSDPVPVYEMVVRVEGSGKWPQDPHAAKLMKQAFILQVARGLTEEHHLESSFATDFLDVCSGDYVFRCHFTFAGELALLKRHGIDTLAFERLTVHLPKHARAVHGLYTGNVVYGPAVRLAKRFVAAQYLSAVFPEELVELLVARLFLHPGRNAEPHSTQVAFARFLHLISTFDWEASSLVVRFDQSSTEAPSYDRSLYCLHVRTSYDDSENPWSVPAGSADALSDLKRLATAALKFTKQQTDLAVLFRRSSKGFAGSLTVNQEAKFSKTSLLAIKNASLSADFLRYLPGFNPTQQLIDELRKNFKETAFFYDKYCPTAVYFRGGDATAIRAFCRDLVL